jgi:molybdenum cofactor synthesis domain-containing protein
MPTAAGIIIEDEILTGKFSDQNGPVLIEVMRRVGADLRRIAVVADDIDAIAREVRTCSDAFDLVVTSGGVGPTHDDVTLMAVADAFDIGLEVRPELVELIERYKMEVNEASLRMATVPIGTELLREGARGFPVLRCRNVLVLPGVPKLFRSKLESVEHLFAGLPIHTTRLYTSEFETAIASRLSAVQDLHANVAIGSYPRSDEPWAVIVTLESRDPDALEHARAALAEVLELVAPPGREHLGD